MKYENIIFDLYGTLVDVWTDERSKKLWESLAWYFCLHQVEYSWKELKKAYFNEVKLQEERLNKEIGGYAEIDLMKVFEQLYLKKGKAVEKSVLSETVLMFRALSMKRLQLYEGVEDLLRSLKEKGRKVYLLTNAQRVFTEREIEMLHLKEYFDDIVGVSNYKNAKITKIILKVDKKSIDYIRTKPLHWSQKELKELNTESHSFIQLKLKVNTELKMLLFSYSDAIEVIEPCWLRDFFAEKIKKMSLVYEV